MPTTSFKVAMEIPSPRDQNLEVKEVPSVTSCKGSRKAIQSMQFVFRAAVIDTSNAITAIRISSRHKITIIQQQSFAQESMTSWESVLSNALGSAGAGVLSRSLTHPLDTVRNECFIKQRPQGTNIHSLMEHRSRRDYRLKELDMAVH